MPDTKVPFLIVGGGIGGLTAALALARGGNKVHLIEGADEFGEVGAGLQLGPNAVTLLEQLGVFESIRDLSHFPDALQALDAVSGEPITSIDLGEAFVKRYGAPYIVIHRNDLHSALLEACRRDDAITLEVKRRAIAVEETGHGAIVRCESGETYECDALVGADGVRSVVRRLMSDDEPVPSGYVAFRGTIAVADAGLGDRGDSMLYWWGPELHLVQYKVRGGKLYNQVAVFKTTLPPDAGMDDARDELLAKFNPCCESVRRSAAQLDHGMRWPMADRDPIPNWSRGAITLLGDAGHAMLQYLAQGGCQAIEDAVTLADMVSEHDDVAAAFAAYQEQRIPRSARVQTTARMFGEMIHLVGVGATLRNALFSQHAPDDYEPVDWLYQLPARAAVAAS
jgi:3-hydroxybenzoate 6-monooxygenase